MKLIGFAGNIESGKDTAAEYFNTKDVNNIHLKFANGIRDTVAVLAGIYKDDKSHRKLFDDRNWKETYPLMVIDGVVFTPRVLMQKVGTDCMRHGLHDNIWVAKVQAEIDVTPKAHFVSVSDVRHPNEYTWLQTYDTSVLVYIDVPIASTDERTQHSSEAYQDFLKQRAQIILANDKTSGLDAYAEKLEKLYKIIESEEYLTTEDKIYV
jgi:hypothetical protein